MIKWPEPVGTVTDDMQMFWTSFGLNEDTPKGTKVHTEAQLKQAVRDALQHAADEIKVEADYSGSNRKAALMWSVEKLRALIKEVE